MTIPNDGKENRESFFARLEPRLAPSELLDVQLAYTLSKYGHRAQLRKELDADGSPIRYFEHPRRVALILLDEVRVFDPTLIVSALLHDAIEDTRDLTPEVIEHCFGADVVKVVKALSKVPKEGYLERLRGSVDWRPYAIKACDRVDNLRSLAGSTPNFITKQCDETADHYLPLMRDRLTHLAPWEHASNLELLVRSLADEVERARLLLTVVVDPK